MSFIYYKVLFLMLIPSFLLIYLLITKQSKIENYFSKSALKKLSISNQYLSNKTRNLLLFLSLIFMIIALARPVSNEKIKEIESNLIPIIIAIDISKSMKANDLYPNRVDFAKRKLLNILEISSNNNIGIILFAKTSFLLSPLTQDFNSLKILLNNLDTTINFDNGTNIYSVIETSQKLLKDYSNKNLILLTDGGDNQNFDKEIKFAKQNNIKIYTIALATKEGSVIQEKNGNYLTDKKGNIVNLKLNEKIKDLSLKTDGGYIEYSLNNSDINQIINDINNKFTKEKFEKKEYKTYTELFYYPLFIAIVLLLFAFSSLPNLKNLKLSIFIIFVSFNFLKTDLLAFSIFDFKTIKEANNAYKEGDFVKASKEFDKLDTNEFRDYNLANSSYKNNNFEEAIKLYENIKTTSSDLEFKRLHNLGNSYVQINDLNNALKKYEEALKLKNDSKTRDNLELVKSILEKKEDNQNNKPQNNQEEKKKDNKASKNNNINKEESKIKQNEMIENIQEEKWLKEIENQKTNSLLKKMESSNEDSITNPW
ncbi:VWA domain-containing protein [Arcobacter aquimarinus]|uniref:VWA domain-containing protein n=1 Tax=Arcobacter aquimarinus TaxID=1315211 RepID=UPI003BB21D76